MLDLVMNFLISNMVSKAFDCITCQGPGFFFPVLLSGSSFPAFTCTILISLGCCSCNSISISV